MFKSKRFIIAVLLIFSFSSVPAFSAELEHVVGAGIGLPYGGFGVSYELGVCDYFAPVLGVGLLPDNIGWNVGARLYYPGRDAKFRARLTALYGTNTLVEHKHSNDDYDTETGMSGGVGLNWRFAPHWALDADFFVVENDVPDGYEQEGSDVKIALGCSFRW